ncbi:MAG: hypothetical protein ACE37H_11070 [Phycisphaeraceae bacterium]
MLGLIGCHKPDLDPNANGYTSPIKPADISYAEVAARYNQTVEPFESLWSRTEVDIEWYELEDDGDRAYRRETGDGKFMYRRPGDTALLVEKLGKTYLWAGSNGERYWLFDMVDGDNKTAYVGEFAKLGQPGRRAFPMPVRPDMVPVLLGLLPLPPVSVLGEAPPVDLYEGRYLVEVDGLRMLIDPQTFRPARVDLTDTAGFSVLTSKLEGRFPVEVEGVPDHRLPTIARKAEVYVSGYDSRLTVSMVFATTEPRRVRDPMFDFDLLNQAMKIDRVEPLDR